MSRQLKADLIKENYALKNELKEADMGHCKLLKELDELKGFYNKEIIENNILADKILCIKEDFNNILKLISRINNA